MIGGRQGDWDERPASDGTAVDPFDDADDFTPAIGGAGIDTPQAGDAGVEALDAITARMAGREHRPEQQEMCSAVAEALATGIHLIVQAGTGTGKSPASLVPAASSGKKVTVAAAAKARL